MEYDVPGWSTKQLVGMLKQMLFWEDPQIISFNLAGQPTDALLHALRGFKSWNVFVTVAMENSLSQQDRWAGSVSSNWTAGIISWIRLFYIL